MREKMTLAGRRGKYSASWARSVFRRRDQNPYWSSRDRRERAWRQSRKRKRDDAGSVDRLVQARVAEVPVPQVLSPFAQELVAHPAAHSQAYWWCPDVRPELERRLPAAMARDKLRICTSWAAAHACILASQGQPVARESARDRQRRQCGAAGVCLCSGAASRRRLAFLMSWRRAMTRALQKPTVSMLALRGPNERRAAADNGTLVVRLQNLATEADTLWYHVSFARYSPFRPVLLRLAELGGDVPGLAAGAVRLRPTYRPNSGDRSCWDVAFDVQATRSVNLDCQANLSLYVVH